MPPERAEDLRLITVPTLRPESRAGSQKTEHHRVVNGCPPVRTAAAPEVTVFQRSQNRSPHCNPAYVAFEQPEPDSNKVQPDGAITLESAYAHPKDAPQHGIEQPRRRHMRVSVHEPNNTAMGRMVA